MIHFCRQNLSSLQLQKKNIYIYSNRFNFIRTTEYSNNTFYTINRFLITFLWYRAKNISNIISN